MRKSERKRKAKLERIYLTDTQKELLRIIYEKDKRLQQKDLLELTGFSKSKISRNLTPLVEKGLVIKEKWGREFIVEITEAGKKVVE
jgi:uncharacterized membrane protein